MQLASHSYHFAAFPLIQAEETPEEQSISIRDPWSGPQTYAEDFYSGGDIRLPLDSRLDVNHLTELDAPSGDIASFLTPGVIAPSLIGSEGLATPDAVLSRTPQPSQGEELEVMEADKDNHELHASVLEEADVSAPVEFDQRELQYPDDESQTSAAGPSLQFESSEDVFDLDSFKEPSYQERDKSVEPAASKSTVILNVSFKLLIISFSQGFRGPYSRWYRGTRFRYERVSHTS